MPTFIPGGTISSYYRIFMNPMLLQQTPPPCHAVRSNFWGLPKWCLASCAVSERENNPQDPTFICRMLLLLPGAKTLEKSLPNQMLKNQRHSVDFMTGIKIIMRFILRLCLHRGTNITRKTQVPVPTVRRGRKETCWKTRAAAFFGGWREKHLVRLDFSATTFHLFFRRNNRQPLDVALLVVWFGITVGQTWRKTGYTSRGRFQNLCLTWQVEKALRRAQYLLCGWESLFRGCWGFGGGCGGNNAHPTLICLAGKSGEPADRERERLRQSTTNGPNYCIGHYVNRWLKF